MDFSGTLFEALVLTGRPVGGFRPHRIYHWLARLAWATPDDARFRWAVDRWGNRFWLNPFYLIDREIIVRGGYELELLKFLEREIRPDAVCLDVGANIGQVSVFMGAMLSRGGAVHAFEPVPQLFGRLASNVEANALGDVVHCHQVALSDVSGVAEFSCSSQSEPNQGQGSLVSELAKSSSKVTVQTARLDDFVRDTHLDRLDLIKIDIQGGEPGFLLGACETVREFKPMILMEVSPEDLSSLGKTSRDLLEQIQDCGYDMWELGSNESQNPIDPSSVPVDFAAPTVVCRWRG